MSLTCSTLICFAAASFWIEPIAPFDAEACFWLKRVIVMGFGRLSAAASASSTAPTLAIVTSAQDVFAPESSMRWRTVAWITSPNRPNTRLRAFSSSNLPPTPRTCSWHPIPGSSPASETWPACEGGGVAGSAEGGVRSASCTRSCAEACPAGVLSPLRRRRLRRGVLVDARRRPLRLGRGSSADGGGERLERGLAAAAGAGGLRRGRLPALAGARAGLRTSVALPGRSTDGWNSVCGW